MGMISASAVLQVRERPVITVKPQAHLQQPVGNAIQVNNKTFLCYSYQLSPYNQVNLTILIKRELSLSLSLSLSTQTFSITPKNSQ